MARTITIEISDEEEKGVPDAVQPYRKQVNENPALMSLLYDIDLMPEQIRLYVNVNRMVAVCELFKLIPPEAIAEAMKPKADTLRE